ncbi:MAG: cytochrome c peroxidase [Bacteroidota bacterium]|nr:cytochrome c peroxidase [Bacteroidota bacterium]
MNISCKKGKDEPLSEIINEIPSNEEISLKVPYGFPYPDVPADNKPTQARIDLGEKLFFDPILSRDNSVSCASCHLPDRFFTDNLTVSIGIEGRKVERNSPTLINVAFQKSMFWDGGNPTLEQQVLAPIDNHNEFDFDVNEIVKRLQKHKDYSTLFQMAYKQAPSVYALVRAIANYERTLIGGTSKYDDYNRTMNSDVFSESEYRGLSIFFGERGECFHCHGGFNFTDNSFQNNGLYLTYPDSGRARITQLPTDVGKFKVPSLRNVEMTAPYMHDGSISTLEEVVAHYVGGFKKHRNKSLIIQKLNLTTQEQSDLVNFLKTLTDKKK